MPVPAPAPVPAPVPVPVCVYAGVVSVVLYAAYEVLYKKYVTDPDDPVALANSQRFFGIIGVATLLTMWPFIIILDATGTEPFEWPNGDQWFHIFLVAVRACLRGFAPLKKSYRASFSFPSQSVFIF